MKFRKKPVVIDAIQWDGTYEGHLNIMVHFPELSNQSLSYHKDNNTVSEWKIATLEGSHIVSSGDFIIKGIKGEFYPCKPDIFEKTYDPV